MAPHLIALASPDPDRPTNSRPEPSGVVADMLEDVGRMLAARRAADAISRHQAAARREPPSPRPLRANETLKLAPYRQIQRTNRVFADRLSTTAANPQRCPHMTEQAIRQQARIGDELAAVTDIIRTLLRRPDFTSHDVLTDLWQTLLTHDPYHASYLRAAALTELARTRP
jgi:hypothetical protein